MSTMPAIRQDVAKEITAFDRLAAEGKHTGLSTREYRQFFHQIGLTTYPRAARVIDLGCGDGLMACELAQAGYTDITAVDVSAGHIARARQRARSLGIEVDYRVADLTDLDAAEAGRYDVALVSGVLHHFPTPATKRHAVATALKLLRPGGLFAGIEPNRWHPYWYLPMLMMRLTWSRLPISFRYVKCHCTENEKNQLSPRELARIFKDLSIGQVSFEPFTYLSPEADETRYHRGMAATYRHLMERVFCRIMPRPHNTSYFVFTAVSEAAT